MVHILSQLSSAIFGHGILNAVISIAVIAGSIALGKFVHGILNPQL